MFCISAPTSPAGAGALSLIWAQGHPTTSELTVRTGTGGDHVGHSLGLEDHVSCTPRGKETETLHGLGKTIPAPSLSRGSERLTSQCPQPDTWAEVSGVGGRSRSWGRVGGGGQTRAPDSACTGREGGPWLQGCPGRPAPSSSERSQPKQGPCPSSPNSEEAAQLDSSQALRHSVLSGRHLS